MRRILFFLGIVLIFSFSCDARENIRELFKNNEAVIYTINIRNFGAVDKNLNGIIDIEDGEKIGTFLSAKDKLKELSKNGINVIYLLPITPSGKLKALGSAGSLYAMDDFNKIAQELDEKNNDKTVYQEAKEFIDEAHALNMNVIVLICRVAGHLI